MSNVTIYAEPAEWYADVPRSVTKHITFGILLFILTFGGFGAWALRAPLAAAVIAQGSFVATGRNKIVQHLEGGIIREILVEEGDTVVEGQPILLLDETAALATERELFLRQVRLEAMEARILAEHSGADRLIFPASIEALRSDFSIASMLDAQTVTFDAAARQLNNDLSLLEQSIEALTVRATGYDYQLISTRTQLEILREDMTAKEQLLDRGLIRRSEVNSIRRAIAEAEGQIGRLTAEIDEITEVSKRYEAQIAQTISERQGAALDELQIVQSELESVREQVRRAENVLSRSEVVAPVSGTIVTLHYYTPGGVIESGKPIAEILPAGEPLIIEVSIARTEVDVVQKGQEATVRLTGLNARTTPVLTGEVFYVSADSIVDRSQELAQEVYVARVSVAPEQLDRVRGFTPTPGMPAEIMIQTEERTFFQYLMKPITDSMNRAFREQ
ncbi:MAG: secretion protein HlyD [Thalassobium sp.]|uniref:HlyD family type I secretion periplasmic adaptor subunit n=1 Tax=Octadecabacter sp. SW4 TaxID=2602067 RepID=UPI000C0FCD17|nr:HlyD family type I secretion periplasmic adaptor subunit [Octadecabacter sp. SW4]PHQ79268.1 MAG: secretion protein HlyD [Thalassobium sp.]QEE36090.1 HlyD family type I secretion periplasmic adaptor subunit [Octadecabacter sp. SW4]|tara:strand:- start:278 stop:1618 length:1341 start_codon:yes stop_codon:yes gene_type:complete